MTTSSASGSVLTPCLNAATLTGLGLEEFLAVAAAGSFSAVEIPIQQVVALGHSRVRDLLEAHGLTAVAASGILPAGPVLPAPVLVDEVAYSACQSGLAQRLEAFAAIGCPVATIVLNPRSHLSSRVAWATAAARLGDLARVAGDYGLVVAVEAVGVGAGLPADLSGPHEVARTLPQLVEIVDAAEASNLAVVVDSFHWAATGADPRHLEVAAAAGIGHVQIADAPPGVPVEEWTDAKRIFPGDGVIPFDVLKAALEANYSGPVSVELFNPTLRALHESQITCRAHHAARTCWTSTGGLR